MRVLAILLLLAVASTGWAQSAGKERVIELKDGDRVVMRADGTMSHYDRTGKLVAMADGVVMVSKDGGRIMMQGRALWREILDVATSSYAQAVGGSRSDQRTIELKDGGRVAVDADGAMARYDAAGNRRNIADGEVMIAKDGGRICMVHGSLWRAEDGGVAAKAAQ